MTDPTLKEEDGVTRINEDKIIPVAECEEGGLYRIAARNARLGVYTETNTRDPAFVILRKKFGQTYLFTEYHWNTAGSFGTARPFEKLDKLPFTFTEGGRVTNNPESEEQAKQKLAVFQFLVKAQAEHIGGDPVDRAGREPS